MKQLSLTEAFELGYALRAFAFSSHCFDARDLGRFWVMDDIVWATPNLAKTAKHLGRLYDESGVWPKTKDDGMRVAMRIIREHLRNPLSKRLTIDVTQEDIDYGTPGDCDDCPVALAIRRILPDAVVKVDGDVIEIDGSTVGAPEKVAVFVNNFDRAFNDFDENENDYDEWREGFSPFSFVLPVKGWK